jgi:hypothetical protein
MILEQFVPDSLYGVTSDLASLKEGIILRLGWES